MGGTLILSFSSPIFKGSAKDTVLQALASAELATMQLIFDARQEALDYYNNQILVEHGGKDEYLKKFSGVWDRVKKGFVYPNKLLLEHIPITEQLVDLKARIYTYQPGRMVGGNKAEKYEELLKSSGWYSTSKTIESQVNLLNDVAVGVFLTPDKKRLQFHIVGAEYWPVYAEDDPLQIEPIGVIYPTARRGTAGEIVYAYWDKDTQASLTKTGELFDEKKNEYGVFNFFFPFRKKVLESRPLLPRTQLAQQNRAIDVAKTGLNQLMKYNGFKQLIITGGANPNDVLELITGESQALLLKGSNTDEQAAEANVLDMQADFISHIEAIKFAMEMAGQAINIRMQWSMDATQASGKALQVSDYKDLDDRKTQCEIYEEGIERPLFNIVSTISSNFNLRVEKGDFSAEFEEPEMELSVSDENSREKHLIETNQTNPVVLMMEKEGINEDEAVSRFIESMAINTIGQSPEPIDEESILSILNNG